MVIEVEKIPDAEKILRDKGFSILSDGEIYAL